MIHHSQKYVMREAAAAPHTEFFLITSPTSKLKFPGTDCITGVCVSSGREQRINLLKKIFILLCR